MKPDIQKRKNIYTLKIYFELVALIQYVYRSKYKYFESKHSIRKNTFSCLV